MLIYEENKFILAAFFSAGKASKQAILDIWLLFRDENDLSLRR